ncbi:MAG: ATP-dependent metallopeptidase FtsH/Yme1/Tma family protein, partial [Clostridiales bacterium]|nr:ATP-dependent metallopeptidase FtsH/Yme1/Tma family protein [Clostridiales bacterium]
MRRFFRGPGFWLLLLVSIIIVVGLFDIGGQQESLSYKKLLKEIKEGKISKLSTNDKGYAVGLRVDSTIPENSFPDKYDFKSFIPDKELFRNDVQIIESERPENRDLKPEDISTDEFSFEWQPQPTAEAPWWASIIPFLVLMVLMVVFWFVFLQQAQGGGNRVMSFGKSRARMQTADKQRVTFADVAGAKEEKDELAEIVDFLKTPRKYLQLGARIPKGVLLIGPPGTGKTLLAKAVSGEAAVPFFTISGSDFVEMFVGVGASRVRDLFEQAKKNAPCIIFIDEIDAVGRHRGAGLGGGHDEREQTLNQLLVEMDGFSTNEGIIVLAATNRHDILDPALLRPGRFDRHVLVGLPDVKGREEILEVHSRGKPLAPEVKLEVLAKRTPGFTGADLENLMNEAAILTARESKKQIEMPELEEAINRVIAGPEKKSRVMTDKDKRLVAYHEAGHAVVAKLIPGADPVHEISIIPRGMAGGYTLTLPEQDKYFISRTELLDEITQLLGGRVAEKLVLDDISTGASNDIERATRMARRMITEYGMSDALGPISYNGQHDEVFIGRDWGSQRIYSETVAASIDAEIKEIIDDGYSRAEKLLSDNIDKLHEVAEALLEREKLDYKEFEEIFE